MTTPSGREASSLIALDAPEGADRTADRGVVVRLAAGSALMLFLELALIRWLGSNIVHLSYFSNFVLLGSFLGIGLGFLISRKPWSVLPATPVILALLVVGVLVFPVSIDRGGDGIIYFTSLMVSGPPPWLVLPVVFVLTASILAGPAEVVGRCFGRLRPLTAYRWDLIGSLIGIGGFTLLSFLQAPSVVWGTIAAALLVWLVGGRRRHRITTAVCGAVVVGGLGFGRGDRAVEGCPARGRGRHRSPHPADRGRTQPRPSLLGPARGRARQRRPGIPAGYRREVQPDPVRPAGLAGAGQRRLPDPAGVVPVHRTGTGLRARPPEAGWGVRDVQLLPRAVADRPARRHRGDRVRPRTLRGPVRRRPGGRHRRGGRCEPAVRAALGTGVQRGRPGNRRRPLPVLRGRRHPGGLPVDARRHPADLGGRGARAGRSVRRDAPVRGPVLHGRGLGCWRPRTSPPSRCCSARPGW